MSDLKVKEKELRGWLNSTDDETVKKGLEAVRKDGTASFIPVLTAIALNHKNVDLQSESLEILKDTKLSSAKELIIEEVKVHRNHPNISKLLGLTWEAGVEIGDELYDFVEIALAADYAALIELYSIIDNDDKGYDYETVSEINLMINEKIEEDPESDSAAMLHTIALMLN
jgi:hypothetical protein